MMKKEDGIIGRSWYLGHRSVHVDVQGIVHTALRGICYPSKRISKSCWQKENWKKKRSLMIENLSEFLIWVTTALEK